MARILVLDTDPVHAALLEDRLHVAGHRVMLAEEPPQAISSAAEGHIDLLVLEMDLPVVPGLEVIRSLRAQAETRTLPIVAFSAKDRREDRLEALRAGADDYLHKPFDTEELLLRVDRLLGSRSASVPTMRGDLANHPTWDLLQYINQSEKTGELVIQGRGASGRLRTRKGQVISARWKKLRGLDAILAIIGTQEGQFRLTTIQLDPTEDTPLERFQIPEILMQAAWIQDQLGKRQEHVPQTGVPLCIAREPLPKLTGELAALPIDTVYEYVAQRPGCRLYDLVDAALAAPSQVRLSIAWLIQHGYVAREETGARPVMSTTEISSSMILDLAIHNLQSSARDAGTDVSALSYLILLEPGKKEAFRTLLTGDPGFQHIHALTHLAEQLDLRQGGSTDFETEFGTLSIHLQTLTQSTSSRAESIVPACAGVLAWLDQGEAEDAVRGIVERLESLSEPGGQQISGVLVADEPAGQALVDRLTQSTRHWRLVRHAPYSLIGVLRLLHPRSSSN